MKELLGSTERHDIRLVLLASDLGARTHNFSLARRKSGVASQTTPWMQMLLDGLLLFDTCHRGVLLECSSTLIGNIRILLGTQNALSQEDVRNMNEDEGTLHLDSTRIEGRNS
jgi:hypothetical protein